MKMRKSQSFKGFRYYLSTKDLLYGGSALKLKAEQLSIRRLRIWRARAIFRMDDASLTTAGNRNWVVLSLDDVGLQGED